MIASAVVGLVGQVIGIFGKKGEARQEALKNVASNMHRTWTDEFITLYWFGPTMAAFFGYSHALVQQQAMIADNSFLFQAQLGITAAVFGLSKIVGKK
jgi:hypothetical protein